MQSDNNCFVFFNHLKLRERKKLRVVIDFMCDLKIMSKQERAYENGCPHRFTLSVDLLRSESVINNR